MDSERSGLLTMTDYQSCWRASELVENETKWKSKRDEFAQKGGGEEEEKNEEEEEGG